MIVYYVQYISSQSSQAKSMKISLGYLVRTAVWAQLLCFMFNNQKLTEEDCHTFHIFLPNFLKSEEGKADLICVLIF